MGSKATLMRENGSIHGLAQAGMSSQGSSDKCLDGTRHVNICNVKAEGIFALGPKIVRSDPKSLATLIRCINSAHKFCAEG